MVLVLPTLKKGLDRRKAPACEPGKRCNPCKCDICEAREAQRAHPAFRGEVDEHLPKSEPCDLTILMAQQSISGNPVRAKTGFLLPCAQ